LPDINAETYPFEVVQQLLDQAAYFSLFSIPGSCGGGAAMASRRKANGVIGVRVSEVLHRFTAGGGAGRGAGGLALDVVGEPLGRFEHRWMVIPPDFRAVPGREPPPTRLNPSRSQRFVMLDAICRFGEGKDGFRGFGTGRTLPVTVGGRSQLLVGAVGNIMEGFGTFAGHEGTYTYCGTLAPERGFSGHLLCRIMDPKGCLRAVTGLPAPRAFPYPEPSILYLIFRGQKRDRTQKTLYTYRRDGQVNGLRLEPQIRLFHCDAAFNPRGALQSLAGVGPVVGDLTATILFNVLAPGAPGTAAAPIAFQDYDEYRFTDGEGRPLGSFGFDGGAGYFVGTPSPEVGEGRAFNMTLRAAPGQRALRFGGFGPIVNGTGAFQGIGGLLAHNSVVGIAPHVLSTVFVARIHDPDGKYRGALNQIRGWAGPGDAQPSGPSVGWGPNPPVRPRCGGKASGVVGARAGREVGNLAVGQKWGDVKGDLGMA
jgi:hypothetical protein